MSGSSLFPPTRRDGVQRLAAFARQAGDRYAKGRNTDFGSDRSSATSKLSPYLQHRLVTEQEVVAAVLTRHSLAASEKYVQEVLWRTYWKGWLEMRPSVWARFLEERDRAQQRCSNARRIVNAEAGMTGIPGYDDWAREMLKTGNLHNHARMWFASIWIFTIRLPWALGADFFLRHLLDADAASNTLSWRRGVKSTQFVNVAATDIATRVAGHFRCSAHVAAPLDKATLIAAAQSAQVKQIVTPYAPVGPVADALARVAPVSASEGITLIKSRRDWGSHFWPFAKKGFFSFRKQIPNGLAQLAIK